MKKKKNYWMLIPAKLKEDLNNIPFRIENHKHKALKFINLLQKEATYDNFDTLKFRDKPSNWFKKIFNGEYKKDFLDLLVQNNIIECSDYYSKNKAQSYSYRINPNYFDLSNSDVSNYSNVSYVDISSSTSSIYILPISSIQLYTPYMLPVLDKVNRNDLKINIQTIQKDVIYDMIDTLSIDYNRIIDKTKEIVQGISVNSFKVDTEIEETYFEVYNRVTNRSYYTTKAAALAYIGKSGHSLIQDKDNFYIEDLDKYVEVKKKNILNSYLTTVKALQKRIYNVSRNNTNNRMDTVFTSMCKYTLDIIKEDNDLIEIDLVNSQFAILANWLMKESCYQNDEVKLFCKLAINGGLYENLAAQLELTRAQSKKMMMSVCFSSHKSHSDLKSKFEKIFPTVHNFIQEFKSSSDKSSAFAIRLQNMESKIFIDGLMTQLIEKKYFHLTKHDSLIVKMDDKDAIVKLLQDYFDTIQFKATIKIEDELVHSGGIDSLNQDEIIQMTDNTQKETGADNGDRISIYSEHFEKIRKNYESYKEAGRDLSRNEIIGLEIMSTKFLPAKILLEKIRA